MTSSLTGGNSTFVVIGGSCGWTATGGVSQVAGFGFLDIGDAVDVTPDGQCTSRKWELGVFSL